MGMGFFLKIFFWWDFIVWEKNDLKECIVELNISFVYFRWFIIYLLVFIDID